MRNFSQTLMQCRLTTDTRLYLVVTPILVFCSESASFHLIQWLLGPPGWLYQFLTCLWRNVKTTGCRHSFIHLFLKVQPHFGAQRSLECFVLVSNLCQCWLMGYTRCFLKIIANVVPPCSRLASFQNLCLYSVSTWLQFTLWNPFGGSVCVFSFTHNA